MSETLLALDAARFGFGGRVVVHVPAFALRAGELVAFVGPNGSGKTTLLRGLAGLLTPQHGTRRLAAGVRVGWVPQQDRIDPAVPMSARDVVAQSFCASLRPWQRPDARALGRVAEALAACGAADFASARWSTLSGGQRQRALVARALAVGADVLLLDEPTASLDVDAEQRVFDLLDALRRRGRIGIALVTHAREALGERADRVILVARGVLRAEAA